MSFLDKTGLSHFWAQCLNKFATKDAIPSVEGLASESYVDNKVASMVDSAPETLNTLNELAAALGDDPNFATTVANQIGTIESEVDGKVSKSGDTMTGNLTIKKSTYPIVRLTEDDTNKALNLQFASGIFDVSAFNVGDSANNYRTVRLCDSSYRSNVSDALALLDTVNGTRNTYKIYHEGNKPTASDVGALPLNPASIEMYAGASANHGGLIDFHYNGSTSDHTSRIIESASSVLDINNVSGGKVRLGTVTAGTWNGSAIAVSYGGTGKTTLATGEVLIGNGTNAITTRAILNNTATGTLGWSGTVGTNLITANTLAYWNGAYSGTSSNISIVGTISTGTWHGSTIGVAYGGTGATTAVAARTNLGITPANIGAIPTSRTVNGKALSANITLSASDVGAIPVTQAIAANTDLNTITTPGFYYCAANSTVATLTNAPSGNAFYMEVGKHAGVYQRVIEYSTGGAAKIYIRNYYSSTWTAWGREYTTWNKPTASELSVLSLSGGTLTGLLTGTRAHFTSTTDASETSQNNVALRLGPATGLHIDIDNNEIIAKSDATTVGLLYLNSSGTVHLGTVTSNLTCTGTITGAKVIGAVYA